MRTVRSSRLTPPTTMAGGTRAVVPSAPLQVSRDLRPLLVEVLQERAPELVPLVASSVELGRDSVAAILDSLAAELASSGLGPGDEPNERGLQLERLIDEVNRCGFE